MTAASVEATHAPVLVVDFGAQYAQLIARRVREAKVYSEIVPHTASVEAIAARQPAAVVLSGGPQSVYAEGAPQVDPRLFELGIPVFGICYGFQAMAAALGGEVARTGVSEFGRTPTTVVERGTLLDNLPDSFSSWMSHGDAVKRAPDGFSVLAHTAGGVGNFVLEIDALDAENMGYMIYFFEKVCAVSGYMLGVNPFNQPGVESYKKNMFALLGKPGYESEKENLEKQLGLC